METTSCQRCRPAPTNRCPARVRPRRPFTCCPSISAAFAKRPPRAPACWRMSPPDATPTFLSFRTAGTTTGRARSAAIATLSTASWHMVQSRNLALAFLLPPAAGRHPLAERSAHLWRRGRPQRWRPQPTRRATRRLPWKPTACATWPRRSPPQDAARFYALLQQEQLTAAEALELARLAAPLYAAADDEAPASEAPEDEPLTPEAVAAAWAQLAEPADRPFGSFGAAGCGWRCSAGQAPPPRSGNSSTRAGSCAG